jgi:hypothetical protein
LRSDDDGYILVVVDAQIILFCHVREFETNTSSPGKQERHMRKEAQNYFDSTTHMLLTGVEKPLHNEDSSQ